MFNISYLDFNFIAISNIYNHHHLNILFSNSTILLYLTLLFFNSIILLYIYDNLSMNV